jgi:two-component system, NarL family, nitrate/nitrite response regulator NarL
MKLCLICDDHVMMREAISGAVQFGWPDAEITQAGDYNTAWAAMATLAPDLCISDLVMPGAGPVEGIRRLREAAPDTPLLVVTGNEDDATLLALFDLGIAGFAPKTSKSAVIEAAIRLVLAGGRYLPPRLVELAAGRSGLVAGAPNVRLTDRQSDVLFRIATGKSNKEIARDLNLSPATVKAHIAAIILALGATNRTDATYKARALGLLTT